MGFFYSVGPFRWLENDSVNSAIVAIAARIRLTDGRPLQAAGRHALDKESLAGASLAPRGPLIENAAAPATQLRVFESVLSARGMRPDQMLRFKAAQRGLNGVNGDVRRIDVAADEGFRRFGK